MRYRGIYHAHSRFSGDGHFTLEALRERARGAGIDFIVMTEHAEDLTPASFREYLESCALLSDSTFLFVPGLEVPYVGKVHVGCFPVASRDTVPLYEEGIRALREAGAITVMHHPSKENFYRDDTLPTIIDQVEVWNARYEGKVVPSIDTLRFVHAVYPGKPQVGGLDLHTRHQFGGPLVVVDADALSVEAIVRAWRSAPLLVEGTHFSFISTRGITGVKWYWYRALRVVYDILRALRRRVTAL